MNDISHLSYSSISTYQTCGRYWEFKYIQKIPQPTASALVFGGAFHGAIEKAILTKSSSTEHWDAAWKKQLEERQEIAWGMDTPESIYNDGLRMLGDKAIMEAISNIKASVIEKPVELTVPGVPIPVIGYIDVITEDGVPGDFKTPNKSWSEDKAQGEMQPLFYLAALSQTGTPVPGGKFRHYVFVKTKVPKVQVIEHEHDLREVFFLFELIQSVWKGISANVFIPNPTSWKCSPNYCEFWNFCRGKKS